MCEETQTFSPDDRFLEAVAAFEEARDAGANPTEAEWLQRYPDVADRLRKYFACAKQLREIAGPLPTRCIDSKVPDVPDYVILEPLPPGGMGVVYKALRKSTGQTVALKLIRPDLLAGLEPNRHRKVVERFITEAQVAALLEHDNIVKVYDVGEVEGLPYYSMRYVEGKSLSALIEGGPLPASRAAVYLEQVARAVHHAHQHAIIHRDLKPNNILIDGKTDRPLVADFGLAKLTDGTQELSRTGEIMGAPPYISPEQARNSKDVTTATDVYGLGATLYAVLTGRPPFRDDTPMGTLMKVREEEPTPPRKINKAVPRDVETICLKCLRKSPAGRYASATELADDLRRFREGRPIHGRRVGILERSVKWMRRKPVAGGLIAVMIGLIGLVNGIWLYRAAKEAQWRAEHSAYVSSLPQAADALSKGFRGKAEEILHNCPLEFRHLEWNLLKRACQPDLTLRDHQHLIMGVVSDLADGELMATATRDGTIRLLDSKTGAERRVVEEGHDGINNLASGNQGRYLAAVWEDGTVRAWDVTGKEHKLVFDESSVGAKTVALARDRPILAAAGGSTVTVWELPSKKQLHALDYPADIYALGLSPDGEGLAAGGWNKDCPLKVWNLRTGKEANHFDIKLLAKDYTVYSLAWGEKLLIAATNNQASYWDTKTGKLKGSLPYYESRARSLAFDPGGGHLAAGFVSGRLRIYDLYEDRKVVFSRGRRGGASVTGLCFDPTSSQIVYASGPEVCVDRWKNRFGVRTEQGRRAAFSPDGTYLVIARDRTVHLLDCQSLQLARKPFSAHDSPIMSMSFHPKDSARLATAAVDGTVRLWDLNDLTNPIPPLACESRVLDLAYSPDGGLLACATESGNVLVWNAITGKLLFAPLKHSTPVRGVSFSPDGKYLATASRDQQVTLWDMTTGKSNGGRSGHLLGVNAVAFGPPGPDCWLASASDDGVKLWKIVESEPRRSWDQNFEHETKVFHVAFSPDGKRVLTVGQDGHVRFWETSTGQELVSLPQGEPNKRAAASQVIMNPRRSQMAVVFDDATIEIWDGTGEWEMAAKNR
jgi:WD40 repeat protein